MTDLISPPSDIGLLEPATSPPERVNYPQVRKADSSLGHYWMVQRDGRYWDRGRVMTFEPHLSQGTIGRSFSCNWRLNDTSVSRLHAALIRKPKRGVYIVDLGSRKGTYVNGQKVEGEMLLMEGDRIRVGDSVLEFWQEEPKGFRPHGRLMLGRVAVAMGFLTIAVLAKFFLF